MKVITFSLWGITPKYLAGAVKNAELALDIYPGWKCRYYVAKSVPYPYIHALSKFDHVELVQKDEWGDWFGMLWRFEAASDPNVEVMISRDVDSRLIPREKAAVDEWLESDKGFHIMRDHPWHKYTILGGMWGAKKGTIPEMTDLIKDFQRKDVYGVDYDFCQNIVWPRIKDNCMIHDEFFGGKPYPTKREGLEWVGPTVDVDDTPVPEHVEALRNSINEG